jgi:hypothetical protein
MGHKMEDCNVGWSAKKSSLGYLSPEEITGFVALYELSLNLGQV